MLCQAKPETLVATPVETPANAPDEQKGSGEPVEFHSLFNSPAGSWQVLGNIGAVDPVGTALPDDYDGDALPNAAEEIGSPWVGDYPVIETAIQPPVTMEIVMESIYTTETAQVASNISSNDVESRVHSGMEDFHRNELAKRTEKVGQSTSTQKVSVSSSMGVESFLSPVSVSVEAGASSTKSTVRANFEAIPFKNDMDRRSVSLKKDSAQTKSRNFRKSIRENKTRSMKVSPNSGLIRAALNIENLSVNMPVRISKITCSLVFETPTGEKIPVQSFMLRNRDYSVFSVEIYGGMQFGPYVIELNRLNTEEIERAIASGYTPKIYIIDYEMTHVRDSNYRAALSSFYTGDNVKIIEENVKGRSAMIKLIGPNMREKARVSVFQMSNEDPLDACVAPASSPDVLISPGAPLKRVLERMMCRGGSVEFDHYVFDFTGIEGSLKGKFYMRHIKSLHGIQNTLPCEEVRMNGTDASGNPVNACVVRLGSLNVENTSGMAMWAAFASSRHYDTMRPLYDDAGNRRYFDDNKLIPMYEGVESTLWVGDLVEIAYLDMADILNFQKSFGTNPLETGEALQFNTRWNKKLVGESPFDPDVHSRYLGAAGLGDKIEFEIELLDTKFLNPEFVSSQTGYEKIYDGFSYRWESDLDARFNFQNAFDFEISFGVGGTPSDWHSISRTADLGIVSFAPPATYVDENNKVPGRELAYCGKYWSYIEQKFIACVQLPDNIDGVGPDGIVHVFIRPALNNAYRETIWPVPYGEVKRFDGVLAQDYPAGSSVVEVENSQGELSPGALEAQTQVSLGGSLHRIAAVGYDLQVYRIYLSPEAGVSHPAGQSVAIGAGFSGYVKTAASAGDAYIDVVPLTPSDLLIEGKVEAGKIIEVAGAPYTVSSVKSRPWVYTITLDAPLFKAHPAGERVFVEGALNRQQVVLKTEPANRFFTDWNNDHPASATVPESASLLYANSITPECAYGLDALLLIKSPGCQGLSVPNMASNWAGGGAFSNDWADAGNYGGLLKTPQYPSVVSSTGTSMKLASVPRSLKAGKTTSRSWQTKKWGDQVVAVWEKKNSASHREIFLAVIDSKSGALVSPEVSASAGLSGVNATPKFAISGDRAVVVWHNKSSEKIYSNVFDLNTGQALLADPVRVDGAPYKNFYADVYLFGDNICFLWTQSSASFMIYSYLRFSKISEMESFAQAPVSFANAPSRVHAGTGSHKYLESALQEGSTLLVLWQSFLNGVTRTWGRYVDLENLAYLSSDFQLTSGQTGEFYYSQAVFDQGKAFLVVVNSSNAQLQGCFIEFSLLSEVCQVQGSNSWLNLGTADFLNLSKSVSAGQGRALVSWHAKSGGLDVHGAVIDMENEKVLSVSSPATPVNYDQSLNQYNPASAISGGGGAVYWFSDEPSGWSLRAANYDVSTGAFLNRRDLLIYQEEDSGVPVSSPASVVELGNGEVLLLFGGSHSLYTQKMNISGKAPYFPVKHGLNNYFVSPLMERDYMLRAWLRWD